MTVVAVGNDAVGGDVERVPVVGDPGEDAAEEGVGSGVRAGVGRGGGLDPFDLGIEGGENGCDVAAGERLVTPPMVAVESDIVVFSCCLIRCQRCLRPTTTT